MNEVILKAFAKINLYLAITSKRSNGYHDILTLMHNVSLYDLIDIEESEKTVFSSNFNLEWNESNTLYKTLDLFEKMTGQRIGLKIHLEKHIPSPSGLGGGSADAAALLWYLCKTRNISDMDEMAILIGSDVPFFINGGCAVVEGIGENINRLEPLELKMEMYFPEIGFSTKYMYKLIDDLGLIGTKGDPYKLYDGIKNKDENLTGQNIYNAFEIAASQRFPLIVNEARTNLDSHRFITMTGSGSAFVGFDLHGISKGDVQLTARPRLILK
uniref:4-diphosphocytidyl-2-C-methyl-D-erythritol kinase n=1 Tax=Mesoaciditoga lauensis TaxID=1495039 RepID=A0A7V3RF10_9BACT